MLLAGALVLGAWLLAADAQLAPSRIEKFRLPDYDDAGRLKSQILGDVADVAADGMVKITNLRVEIYKEGKLDAVLWAADCLFNQKDRSLVSDSNVRLERFGVVIRGKGLRWDNGRQRAEILDQARVELRNRGLWKRYARE